MTNDESQSVAVSIGEIKTAVNYIKESTERRLTNNESFQITVQKELSEHANEITAIKSTMKSNMIWITGIVSVMSLGSPFLVRLIFG